MGSKLQGQGELNLVLPADMDLVHNDFANELEKSIYFRTLIYIK